MVAAITLAYLRVVVSCLIFSATFWRNGLAAAYYDATKLTDAMVVRYRWPAQVRGDRLKNIIVRRREGEGSHFFGLDGTAARR